jgi:hypothetical protein
MFRCSASPESGIDAWRISGFSEDLRGYRVGKGYEARKRAFEFRNPIVKLNI